MRILLSGGFKTENIANAIRPKFESNGDEIVVEMFVENIENLYLRGESFDKIIITEQSLTQDFNIKDDNVVRNRINTFAQQQEVHDNKIVFLTQYSRLASTILDEIVSIKDKSVIILKQPRYTVTFFQELITSDFSQLPREWIYNLETAIQNDIENNNRQQIETQESTSTTSQAEPEWEEPEDDKNSEFDTPGFVDPEDWSDPDENDPNTPIEFDDPSTWGTDTEGDWEPDQEGNWEPDTQPNEFEPNETPENTFESNGTQGGNVFETFENDGTQGVTDFDNPDNWGEQPSDTHGFETFENGENQDTSWGEQPLDTNGDGFETFEQAGNAELTNENTPVTFEEPTEDDINTGYNEQVTDESQSTIGTETQSFEDITLQNRQVEEPQSFDNQTQSFDENQEAGLYDTQGFTETPVEEPTQTFETPNTNGATPQQNSTTFVGIPMPQQNNQQSFGDWEESNGNQNNSTDDWEEQNTSDFNNDIYENQNNSQVNYGNDVNNTNSNGFNDGLYGNNDGYSTQNNMNTGNNASLGNQNQGGGSFDISDYDNNRTQSFNDDIYNETPQDFQPVNTGVPPMMQGMSINKVMTQLQNELKPFANRGNSIVFTGCGGCGTSILAYSTAKLASVLGFNTLLVDMDTEGRAQDYISRDNYISMNTDGASLMAAINSGASVESNVTKPNPGLSLLTMGIGGDTAPVNDIIHKEKISRFVNAAKSKYHFVIYDIPFKDATSYLSEITYNADNLAFVIDASNWGMTKAMINTCNIPSEEMQSTIFNKSQIIFNKYRGMQEFMGKKIRNMQDVLRITDDKVMELVGEDIGCYFSDMSIVGVINEDPNFEMGWFNTKQYVDTQAGQMMFCNLLRNIVLNK